jgi:hypothetical protein
MYINVRKGQREGERESERASEKWRERESDLRQVGGASSSSLLLSA